MPKIILKYKSPEFEENAQSDKTLNDCEMHGCPLSGEHKAPKHRALDEYYHFCADHIRDYNKAWDFFSGMSETEIEKHVLKSHYGDRPTWKPSLHEDPEEVLFKTAQKTYFGEGASEKQNEEQHKNRAYNNFDSSTPEHEALALMGLAVPITIDEIKTRYKTLAKKYHPDLNRNDPKCEELLKRVNMAYTILKLAFAEYKRLPDHKS